MCFFPQGLNNLNPKSGQSPPVFHMELSFLFSGEKNLQPPFSGSYRTSEPF